MAATSDSPLTDTETAANAPGFASILERLAGNANRLYQQLTGGGVDGAAPTIERNPQGRYGRDYSGPPYGPAPRHPIAAFCGIAPQGAIVDERSITVPAGESVAMPVRLWVRGHHQHPDAPYSRGYWYGYVNRASGSNSDLVIANYGGTAGVGYGSTTTYTVASTSSALVDFDADGSSTEFYLPLVPGLNMSNVTFVNQGSADIYISTLSLNQIAKRRH